MQDCCFSFKKKTAINAGPVKNKKWKNKKYVCKFNTISWLQILQT